MSIIKVKNMYYTVVWKNESFGFKKESDAIKCAKKLTYSNPDYTALIIVWKKTDNNVNYYEVRLFNWILGPLFSDELVDLF